MYRLKSMKSGLKHSSKVFVDMVAVVHLKAETERDILFLIVFTYDSLFFNRLHIDTERKKCLHQ